MNFMVKQYSTAGDSSISSSSPMLISEYFTIKDKQPTVAPKTFSKQDILESSLGLKTISFQTFDLAPHEPQPKQSLAYSKVTYFDLNQ